MEIKNMTKAAQHRVLQISRKKKKEKKEKKRKEKEEKTHQNDGESCCCAGNDGQVAEKLVFQFLVATLQ